MNTPAERPADCVVVFDGECVLCAASVRFVMRRDARGRVAFATAQGAAGRALLREHGLDPEAAASVVAIRDGRAFVRSDAALEIARHLGPWRILRVLRFVPRAVRDAVYEAVARNRYRGFGRRERCFVPTPAERARFLDPPRAAGGEDGPC